MIAYTRRRRRGLIYVLVLGTAAIVAVIGLSALTVVRVQRRGSEDIADLAKARAYSRSAVEWGLQVITYDDDWRSMRSNGAWTTDQAIGDGTFTVHVIDPTDGDIGNKDNDPVILTGIGNAGDATFRMSVRLETFGSPLTCLETAMHSADVMTINGAAIVCNQTISTNAYSNASSAYVFADVESAGNLYGGTYYGSNASNVPERTMPDSSVFDYYVSNGATIPLANLNKSGSTYSLENVSLHPEHNPYSGGINNEGIYVINCGGKVIRVREVHIDGTLVLLNTLLVSVEGSVDWTAAVGNYPALMIQGDATIKYDDDTLDGEESMITGLIYVSDDVTITNDVRINGALVVGDRLDIAGSLSLTYDQTSHDNPPPGFGEQGAFQIVPGSWAPVVVE